MKKVEKESQARPMSSADRVEALLSTAKEELSTEAEKAMVKRIKCKLQDLKAATLIVGNLKREVEEMKLELQQDIEAIEGA